MIAGPTGSGKTTLTNFLRYVYHLNFGYYINADDIQAILKRNGKMSFRRFGLKITPDSFSSFFDAHSLKSNCQGVHFFIRRNTLYLNQPLNNFSYFAALFADFIRQQLMEAQQTFSFETVMSGSDKITLLQQAKSAGYRIYLYYVATDDVLINKDRIANRISKGGHPVPETKVEQRYYRSLNQLLTAIQLTDRTYVFDNSGTEHKLVAEITGGREINFDPAFVPNWFDEFVLQRI
jgi:predicted ABC-type ATPase